MFSCDVHSTGIIFVTAQCLMSGIEVAQDPTASLFLAVGRALASCQHRTATSCRNYIFIYIIIEGSLEVKLPTIWTDEKQRWEESAKRREEERRSKKRKSQMRDEKLHAVVARSTFRSQNAQSTPGPDHYWKLRCRKSARRCGAKHISKSKVSKTDRFRALLEIEMSKKCTLLWREAYFEVKMLKAPHVRTTLVGSDVVSRGRRKGLCTLSKASKT